MRKFHIYTSVIILFLSNALIATSHASVIDATPNNYIDILPNLVAGDVLQLSAGTYNLGLPVSNIHGTANNPIIITGPESGDPAVFNARNCCNTIQLSNTSHLTIKHLKLDGNDIPHIDAINASGTNHHITIENLLIVNHGGNGSDPDNQLTNGISSFGPAWDWVIRSNTIIGAGTGMYLGNWQGNGWPFVGGLIEYNVVINTLGYNIQIKHMNSRSDANGSAIPGMPSEPRKTIIRHNVFSKASNAQFGDWARPSLLVGHFPLTGDGSNDIYEIYGNFFYENPADALFQGEGNIAFYNNLLFNSVGSAINISPHNHLPRKIIVFQNTVVASDTGIRIVGVDTDYEQKVIANAVFANVPISTAVTQIDNVTDAYINAANYVANPSNDIATIDLYPLNNTLISNMVDQSSLNEFTDWNKDFSSNNHDGTWRGAYAGQGTNAGWKLALTTKLAPDDTAPSDDNSGGGTYIENIDTNSTDSAQSEQPGGAGSLAIFEFLILMFGFTLMRKLT